MNRLNQHDFRSCEETLDLEQMRGSRLIRPVAGLLITCSADCFAADLLAQELTPGACLIQRTAGNIVPPFGAGHEAEEELIERAVDRLRVDAVIVCGHHPCAIAEHLLTPGAPVDDFVLRDWLSHAETARRCVQGVSGASDRGVSERARAAAAHNVLAQMTNLRTHSAVAAALARGSLKLWGWLHDSELLCSRAAPEAFERPVALHPEQNGLLRPERLRRRRPCPLPSIGFPYLA